MTGRTQSSHVASNDREARRALGHLAYRRLSLHGSIFENQRGQFPAIVTPADFHQLFRFRIAPDRRAKR
jgi:hypothetical protein